jgi:transcriptional regulator with GAF, ATPase, and Fis domain
MRSMIESLASRRSIDHETLFVALRQLVERVSRAVDGQSVLDDCLDIVVDLLGADRGLILVAFADGTTMPVNARRKGASLTTAEREEISKTIVREALESGKLVSFQPAAQITKSVTALGIFAALAAPLALGDDKRGVLYVDFRDQRKIVEPSHVDFFVSAALLVGAVLQQHAKGETARAHLREAQGHTTQARKTPSIDELLATPSMTAVREEVKTAIASEASILILGESGTGKTLLAQAIAEASGRRPIVRAMLGGSDDLNTITSELFGHERGSFSGAATKRIGLVEYANNGTLVLDELLNLPTHAQKLLLDFTQFGTYRPLGHQAAEPKRSSIRIIAATNGDLRAAIRDGRFREDLFHRLAQVTLDIPPLRARREDIPLLAEQTLARVDPARKWTMSVALRRLLVSDTIAWSGNVRQLERVIGRARDRALVRDPETTQLVPEHLEARDLDGIEPVAASIAPGAPPSEADPASDWQKLQADRARIDEREVDVLRAVLARHNGVVAYAARELGIARTTLASRLETLGIRSKK